VCGVPGGDTNAVTYEFEGVLMMCWVRCFELVQRMEPLYDPTSGKLLLRVAMCGGHFVGQSQLLQRFARRNYDDDGDTTIGVNVITRDAEINGESCRLEFVDIAGKERFRSIAVIFLRNAIGVIVTFSVKDERSFEAVRERYAIAMRACHLMLLILMLLRMASSSSCVLNSCRVPDALCTETHHSFSAAVDILATRFG
jgi:hypothetical protein